MWAIANMSLKSEFAAVMLKYAFGVPLNRICMKPLFLSMVATV